MWSSVCKGGYAGCCANSLPSNGTQPLFCIYPAFFSACFASHCAFFSAYCSSLRLCHPQHLPVGLRPQPHVFASAISVLLFILPSGVLRSVIAVFTRRIQVWMVRRPVCTGFFISCRKNKQPACRPQLNSADPRPISSVEKQMSGGFF